MPEPAMPPMGRAGAPRRPVAYAVQRHVLARSIAIALAVGCILSVANQWEYLAPPRITPGLALRLAINFAVPFVVASVSAILNRPR